jgi:hypothetical protein
MAWDLRFLQRCCLLGCDAVSTYKELLTPQKIVLLSPSESTFWIAWPWTWRNTAVSKRQLVTCLHGVISHKTCIFKSTLFAGNMWNSHGQSLRFVFKIACLCYSAQCPLTETYLKTTTFGRLIFTSMPRQIWRKMLQMGGKFYFPS